MEETNRVKASPAIRKIAKQYNIDLNEIVGTGEGGRIEAENIESYLLNRRHLSFSQMAEGDKKNLDDAIDTNEADEYASYMDKSLMDSEAEESSNEKPNYDEEDYGISFLGDDIEVEVYPAQKNEAEFTKEDAENINRDFARLFVVADGNNDENVEANMNDEPQEEVEEAMDLNDAEEENCKDEAPLEEGECLSFNDECEDSEEECNCCEDEDYFYDEDDEDECCCKEHHHHGEEEKCQPIEISFTVNRMPLDELLEECSGENDSLMVNAVVKSLALAIYDQDNEFDGRINVVKIGEDDIEVKTAVNALGENIENIVYEEPYDHADVFVNVWDLGDFSFTKFTRPDAGMVNVFLNKNSRKVIIDSVSDEYCVCIDTCAFMMKALKENLANPREMNERSVEPVVINEDDFDFMDDDYDEDYDE